MSTAKAARTRSMTRTLAPYLWLAPGAFGLLVVVVYPLLYGFWLSFHAGDPVFGSLRFSGLASYRHILGDPVFRYSLAITLVFTGLAVAGTLALGTAVALFLNRPFPGRSVVAVCVLLPWATPRVAGTVVWKWIFDDQGGLANTLLAGTLGAETWRTFAWFAHPAAALGVAVLLVIWQGFPFIAFSVLAALQSVSRDVLDAAAIDGASAVQRIRHIQLPLIRPVLIVLTLLSIIWDLKVFDQVYLLTQGGPNHRTAVLGVYLFNRSAESPGQAAAMAMVLVVLTAAVSAVYVRRALREEA